MIIFIAILIIGGIFMYTYVETERQEIRKKQEALLKAEDALDARIKVEEARRHKEMIEKPYDPQV